jgi:hypothetical protein
VSDDRGRGIRRSCFPVANDRDAGAWYLPG